LNIGHWQNNGIDEADAWGVLLADMLHHIANAHQAEFGRDTRETTTRVRAAFDREMANATSPRLGEFVVDAGRTSQPPNER
jgi:hypothetical protein